MTEPLDSSHPPPPSQPTNLNYQSPGRTPPPVPPNQKVRQFFLGFGLGIALSAIVWTLEFKSMMGPLAGGGIFIIPVIKLATGITFVCVRRWRSIGLGILVSLALGFLIFFGVCTAAILKI